MMHIEKQRSTVPRRPSEVDTSGATATATARAHTRMCHSADNLELSVGVRLNLKRFGNRDIRVVGSCCEVPQFSRRKIDLIHRTMRGKFAEARLARENSILSLRLTPGRCELLFSQW